MRPMTLHVLVGLELKPSDAHVLDTALLFARELGAEAHLVHALDAGSTLSDEDAAHITAAGRALAHKVEERVAQAREALAAVGARHATLGVTLHVHTEEGRPHEALTALADQLAAQGGECLIVTGAGRLQGSVLERILGSTTDALLRHAGCPVLVVPHGETRGPRDGRWLVAVDGSEPSERALTWTLRWAPVLNAGIALVHASSDVAAAKSMRAWLVAHANPAVAALAEHLEVIEDAPFAAITRSAEDRKATLVVLGSHARSGLARAFLGSVASSVVQHATVPVLCVR